MSLYIGVDAGGTKVLAGEVTPEGHVVRAAHRRTPERDLPVADLEDAITEAMLEVAGGRPISGVGLALAGLVDAVGESVRFATHLPWREAPVRSSLAERWGCVVALDNDANCAALAERAFGAARGVGDVVMVTVGTGIGGALLSAGRLVRGRNGMAGEFGHMQVESEGLLCGCGLRGCWEQYASGDALVRAAGSTFVDGPAVTAAALDGDALAMAAFETVGDRLGVGLASLVAALDPELVVVGGGVSEAGDLLLDPARSAMARSLHGATHRFLPPVVAARCGPEAGVVGAALLARTQATA